MLNTTIFYFNRRSWIIKQFALISNRFIFELFTNKLKATPWTTSWEPYYLEDTFMGGNFIWSDF